ncbi:MAG: hypothetical protein LBJ10_03310, partial [Clostridiales bacterium]|nr:hypothetical protein [Clostridiales bacterium]
ASASGGSAEEAARVGLEKIIGGGAIGDGEIGLVDIPKSYGAGYGDMIRAACFGHFGRQLDMENVKVLDMESHLGFGFSLAAAASLVRAALSIYLANVLGCERGYVAGASAACGVNSAEGADLGANESEGENMGAGADLGAAPGAAPGAAHTSDPGASANMGAVPGAGAAGGGALWELNGARRAAIISSYTQDGQFGFVSLTDSKDNMRKDAKINSRVAMLPIRFESAGELISKIDALDASAKGGALRNAYDMAWGAYESTQRAGKFTAAILFDSRRALREELALLKQRANNLMPGLNPGNGSGNPDNGGGNPDSGGIGGNPETRGASRAGSEEYESARGSFLTTAPLGPAAKIVYMNPPESNQNLPPAYLAMMAYPGRRTPYVEFLDSDFLKRVCDIDSRFKDFGIELCMIGGANRVAHDNLGISPDILTGASLGELAMLFSYDGMPFGLDSAQDPSVYDMFLAFRDIYRHSPNQMLSCYVRGDLDELERAAAGNASAGGGSAGEHVTSGAGGGSADEHVTSGAGGANCEHSASGGGAGEHVTSGGSTDGEDGVYILVKASPRDALVSGKAESLKRVLGGGAFFASPMPDGLTVHTPLVRHFAKPIYDAAMRCQKRLSPSLGFEVYSSCRKEPVGGTPEALAEFISHILTEQCDFFGLLETVYGAGGRVFIDMSAASACLSWAKATFAGRRALCFSFYPQGGGVDGSAFRMAAKLLANGIRFDVRTFLGSFEFDWLDRASYRKRISMGLEDRLEKLGSRNLLGPPQKPDALRVDEAPRMSGARELGEAPQVAGARELGEAPPAAFGADATTRANLANSSEQRIATEPLAYAAAFAARGLLNNFKAYQLYLKGEAAALSHISSHNAALSNAPGQLNQQPPQQRLSAQKAPELRQRRHSQPSPALQPEPRPEPKPRPAPQLTLARQTRQTHAQPQP